MLTMLAAGCTLLAIGLLGAHATVLVIGACQLITSGLLAWYLTSAMVSQAAFGPRPSLASLVPPGQQPRSWPTSMTSPRTAWGKHICSTGDDQDSARVAGIRTRARVPDIS
ncbi:hypothetical protein [Pseudonocardia xinjiangensis]|uniref:Uncharacterized protein n=1 Tax=Pseudonocardia xinjiangensis TaxID=75289 RepID=A0ABX1RAE7_9PSEU|nr:hypothetical protein [Pseudonocardia xinjiangensis]NMH77355.1 hypothetical protein [Pseudonocardia xinjiangensis]